MKLIDLFNENLTPNWEVFKNLFPEMLTSPHSKRWHHEGNAYEHSRLVYNAMEKYVNENKEHENYDEWKLIMLSAAMLHDIGKPSTTMWDETNGDWCCRRHGEAGERLFREVFFDERLDLREKVAYMVRYHMLLHHTLMKKEERREHELIQLDNGLVPFEDMVTLNLCDMEGSINEENAPENLKIHKDELLEAIDIVRKSGNSNQWKYVNERTAKMYVMIGIPGSGKSTFAEKLKETEKVRGFLTLPIISRDTVRIEMGMCNEGEKCVGNDKQEKEVTKRIEEQIKGLSSMGMSFIVDNTSLKKKYRDTFKKYIERYDVAPIYVYVEAPSLEENYKRRDGQINEDIIKRMWDSFEFPSRSECYELWLVDQRSKKTYKL